MGALLLLVGLVMYIMSRRRHEPPEERKLKKAIAELRMKLRITAADGFLLSSDRSRGFSVSCQQWQRGQPVFIQRTFMEAAARLSMFQDFDIHQFDAFCIFLRCSRGDNEGSERSATPEYDALCNWLLVVCKALISPALTRIGEAGGDNSFIDSECNLPNDERFSYFEKRLCKARIWSDMGGSLFQRLRQIAQVSDCARE